MSSSGIQSISSGPLIIRTYNDSTSSDVTYVLKDYDYPVSSNYVLITSTNGQLVPSDNIYISSVTVSTITADTGYISYLSANIISSGIIYTDILSSNSIYTDILSSNSIYTNLLSSNAIYTNLLSSNAIYSDNGRFSTIFLSSVFGFSPVQFYSPIRINNTNPPSDEAQLFVNGTSIFSEPGAQSTSQISGVNIWGLPNGNPITSSIQTSRTIDISEPLSKINFQLIGSGGSPINGNSAVNYDLPGIGTYIAGTLSVKQGDKLQFNIGTVGDSSNGSKGTSLVYLSSIGAGNFISTLVCIAGAGGGNGYADFISSSSGGGHGGGASGGVTTQGNIDFYALGTNGYDGLSTINGNYQSFADGGQGGQLLSGGNGGTSPEGLNGGDGGSPNTTTLLTTGGLVDGGAGGIGTKIGGYGGGGYSGGGGGAASLNVSAGGGGGSTYIATSTLSNYLYNLVCLGGQWISQNNATPFGQDYGLPNNPGYAEITGYQPNETLHTNGDINCRVLRYEMLDPPINGIGGAAALWSLYPAIDIVHMNDNPIVECGGIEVDLGGITVSNFVNIRAGVNDSDTAGGFMSKFIRTASSGTQTIDYQVAGDPNEFGSNTWQDARYVYNPANTPDLRQVWGIVTSSNITPVGSTIGDIHFYNSVYVDGNVGIGTVNPTTKLQIVGITSTNNLTTSSITTNATSLNIVAANTSTIGNLNVTDSLNVANITTLSGITYTNLLSSNIISSSVTNTNILNANTISSGNVVNSLTSLSNSISLSGNTGNITISAAPQVDIIQYDSTNIANNYGKYAILLDNSANPITLTSTSPPNPPPNGAFINILNQSGTIYTVNTSGIVHTLNNNTLITPIYYQPTTSWYAPSYYNISPLYIYINDSPTESLAASGYKVSFIGNTFTTLDYVISGGGGGGGGGEDRTTAGRSRYGGGGGGSGYLSSSVNFFGSNDLFVYNSQKTPGTNSISLSNFSSIVVNLGGGGSGGANDDDDDNGGPGGNGTETKLQIHYLNGTITTITAFGGSGGQGALFANKGGDGGAGFNGGGGGMGGVDTLGDSPGPGIGGSGQITIGGANGQTGFEWNSGVGGGLGGGANGYAQVNDDADNAGGGGGAGPGVSIADGSSTGGRGGASYSDPGIDNQSAQVGVAYSGAGGGGASNNNGGGWQNAQQGGKGYAILWIHN